MNPKVSKKLPKVMLALTLPVLVTLCVLCAGFTSMFIGIGFVEGVAKPGKKYTQEAVYIGRETNGWADYQCAALCVEVYGGGAVHEPRIMKQEGDPCGHCLVPRDLSHLEELGTAYSESQCGSMAGQAGYLAYFYDYSTSVCAVEGKYEYVGLEDTRKACIASAKQAGYPNAIYVSENKRCLGLQVSNKDVHFF